MKKWIAVLLACIMVFCASFAFADNPANQIGTNGARKLLELYGSYALHVIGYDTETGEDIYSWYMYFENGSDGYKYVFEDDTGYVMAFFNLSLCIYDSDDGTVTADTLTAEEYGERVGAYLDAVPFCLSDAEIPSGLPQGATSFETSETVTALDEKGDTLSYRAVCQVSVSTREILSAKVYLTSGGQEALILETISTPNAVYDIPSVFIEATDLSGANDGSSEEAQLVYCETCGGWYEEGNEFRNHICVPKESGE